MNIQVRICYSQTTPESVDDGELSDSGIEEEFNVTESDIDEGETVVDYLERYALRGGYNQPSSSAWCQNVWYSTGYYTEDYRSGTEEERTMHITGLSESESVELYNRIKK